LSNKLDGLQDTDVTRHHAEDGHTDPALDKDADVGELEEALRAILGYGGAEQLFVKSTGDMGYNNEEGSQSSQALDSESALVDDDDDDDGAGMQNGV